MTRISEVKRDFDIKLSTFEAAQDNLLPRAEAVDAVLIQHSNDFRALWAHLNEIRRQMGIAEASTNLPFLVRRRA